MNIILFKPLIPFQICITLNSKNKMEKVKNVLFAAAGVAVGVVVGMAVYEKFVKAHVVAPTT
jgi:uncharacterized protein YebE (UPF0316 family)